MKNNKILAGLTLPLKFNSGNIVDGEGKIIMRANRDANTTPPLSPGGRDAMLKLATELLNEAFQYDKADHILKRLGY